MGEKAGATGTPSLARQSPSGRRTVEPGSATRLSTALRSLAFRVRGFITTSFARSSSRSASMLRPWRCAADGAGGSFRSSSDCRHPSVRRGAALGPLGTPAVGEAWSRSEGPSDGDRVTADAPSLSIIPSYDGARRWRVERRPRCGLGARRSRPNGSAGCCSGCVASQSAIAVHASARVHPSGGQIPFARSSATSTVPGKWRRSSSLGRSGSRTNRCQSSVLRGGEAAGPAASWVVAASPCPAGVTSPPSAASVA